MIELHISHTKGYFWALRVFPFIIDLLSWFLFLLFSKFQVETPTFKFKIVQHPFVNWDLAVGIKFLTIGYLCEIWKEFSSQERSKSRKNHFKTMGDNEFCDQCLFETSMF